MDKHSHFYLSCIISYSFVNQPEKIIILKGYSSSWSLINGNSMWNFDDYFELFRVIE